MITCLKILADTTARLVWRAAILARCGSGELFKCLHKGGIAPESGDIKGITDAAIQIQRLSGMFYLLAA